MSFPQYDHYKDSGVEWLGAVPEHWTIVRADAVLDTSRNSIEAAALSGKAVFHYSIPVVQTTGNGKVEDGSEIDSSKLVVSVPQVLISKLNPRKATTCIASPKDVLTVCSSEFVPLIPRSAEIRFIHYLVQTDNYRCRLESLVESATKSHQRVSPSDVVAFRWAFPSRDEQAVIAAFLDRETVKIDALVGEQRRLIELLKEKRQAVISHAVTKGLNPHAPMKPSGIEWLGDVPGHWEIARLGYYATVENGSTPSRDNSSFWTDGDIPWLSSGEVNQYQITVASQYITREAFESTSLRLLPVGAIIVGMIGQGKTRGTSAILAIESTINQNMAAIITGSQLQPEFVHFVFQSMFDYLREYGRGGQQAALNCEILASVRIPIPPLNEQREISRYLEDCRVRFDMLAAEAECAIGLLQERRTALISAAVTGKIDVRNAVEAEVAV